MNYLTEEQIIKQAFLSEFVDGALQTLKDKVDFKHKPFELLFGTLVPSVVFSKSFLFGGLLFLAEAAGFGLGQLGEMIDVKLGLRDKNPDLSDDKLKETADSVVDDISGGFSVEQIGNFLKDKWESLKGFVSEKFSSDYYSMLNELKIVKGSLSEDDYLTAKAYAVYSTNLFSHTNTSFILKEAKFIPKSALAGALYYVLKRAAVGLMGLGVAGGVVNVASPGSVAVEEKQQEKSNIFMPKSLDIGGKTQTYNNEKNNVASTIIDFLDKEFVFKDNSNTKDLTFSEKFKELKNKDILSSIEMKKLLNNISIQNSGTDIATINEWSVFSAPDINSIAKLFFPTIKDEGIEEPKTQVAQKPTQKPSIKRDKREDDFMRYFS